MTARLESVTIQIIALIRFAWRCGVPSVCLFANPAIRHPSAVMEETTSTNLRQSSGMSYGDIIVIYFHAPNYCVMQPANCSAPLPTPLPPHRAPGHKAIATASVSGQAILPSFRLLPQHPVKSDCNGSQRHDRRAGVECH